MRWGILFAALVAAAGCAGKSESDDDASGRENDAGRGGTGGTGTGGTGTGGTGGFVDANCTDLSADAPAAKVDYGGPDAAPTPKGGAIASGTYYLDTELVYGEGAACVDLRASSNALGISIVEVVRFEATSASSGALELALDATAQGNATRVTGAGTYTTTGTMIAVTPTCGNTSDGSGAGAAVPYTASGDEFILFDDGTATCSPVVATFRKL